MLTFKNVAVAISGGVDSAVAALLLKKKGFNVHGVFMENWDAVDETGGHCTQHDDYRDAQHVCSKLQIPLTKVNFVKQYWNEVFTPLLQEYRAGCTPNVDVLCNRHIKFGHFFHYARNTLAADAIATGHYANSSFGPYLECYSCSDHNRLLFARDDCKDQTLFLSQINQEALQRTMLPLADLTKAQVKDLARHNDLQAIADRPESMGICFIGSRNFQRFIEEYIEDKAGDFIDVDSGEIVGAHSGVHKWTLGQRATNVKSARRKSYFVVRKNVTKNIIYVGEGHDHPAILTRTVCTAPPHWIASMPPALAENDVFRCRMQYGHGQSRVSCTMLRVEKGLVLYLDNYRRAITPSQYAVFSTHNECLGSAKIINLGITKFHQSYSSAAAAAANMTTAVQKRATKRRKKLQPIIQ